MPHAPSEATPVPGSSGDRWLWLAAFGATLVGLAVSGYLTVTALQGAPPVCLAGDCAAVAASPYARFLGLPTATWGLLLFFVVAVLSATAFRARRVPARLAVTMLGVTVFGATFSLYLLWIQIAVLRAVCSWCALSDAVWGVLLVLALVAVLRAD